MPQVLTQELVDELGQGEDPLVLLECVVGETYLAEPVPTDVEVGPDGDYYVSTLPGFPELPGSGAVWRINADTGALTRVATGSFGAVDLAVARDGRVYVAELFAARISAITPSGDVSAVTEVPTPGAIEVARDGRIYATTGSSARRAPSSSSRRSARRGDGPSARSTICPPPVTRRQRGPPSIPDMEVMLRCRVPDRPGALATLAGVIGESGGDIQAVDVLETGVDDALDDLVVVVDQPAQLQLILDRVRALEGFTVVHAGASRGHPGDAVTRIAVRLEGLMSGAMTLDHGLAALIGGLLRASRAELVDAGVSEEPTDRRLVLAVDDRVLVVERDYRFAGVERERAQALLRVAIEGLRARVR